MRDFIKRLSDKLDWTKNLGDAVLAQQADIMDATPAAFDMVQRISR